MERNEGDHYEHKHQNMEDKREWQESKGKAVRASWVKELGPEQGNDRGTDHHDHEANGDQGDADGGAAQAHGPCHEAHVTSA